MDDETVKAFLRFLKADVKVLIIMYGCHTPLYYGTVEEVPKHIADMHLVSKCFDTEAMEPLVGLLIDYKRKGE